MRYPRLGLICGALVATLMAAVVPAIAAATTPPATSDSYICFASGACSRVEVRPELPDNSQPRLIHGLPAPGGEYRQVQLCVYNAGDLYADRHVAIDDISQLRLTVHTGDESRELTAQWSNMYDEYNMCGDGGGRAFVAYADVMIPDGLAPPFGMSEMWFTLEGASATIVSDAIGYGTSVAYTAVKRVISQRWVSVGGRRVLLVRATVLSTLFPFASRARPITIRCGRTDAMSVAHRSRGKGPDDLPSEDPIEPDAVSQVIRLTHPTDRVVCRFLVPPQRGKEWYLVASVRRTAALQDLLSNARVWYLPHALSMR